MRNKLILVVLVWVLVLILSGCSASWHYQKAIEKNPELIKSTLDSLKSYHVEWVDSTIYIFRKIPLKVVSDTGHVVRPIYLRDSVYPEDTLTAHSSDGLAHASTWFKDGNQHLITYATIDTLINWRDSVEVRNKTIHEQTRIIEQREVEIKEKETFIQKLKRILLIVASVAGVLLLIGVFIFGKRIIRIFGNNK